MQILEGCVCVWTGVCAHGFQYFLLWFQAFRACSKALQELNSTVNTRVSWTQNSAVLLVLLDHSSPLFHWITVSLSFTGSQFPTLSLDHSFPIFYWITVPPSFTGSQFPSLLLGHCFSFTGSPFSLFYWVTIFSLLLVTVSLPYSHCTVSHRESHTPCSEWLSV